MPIPILQYGVKVRDPTTKEFSDLAALRGGQGPQGATGPGVPAGGTDGDVLVKNGAEDYAARWTNTPPQMGSLATIETSPATQAHAVGEYIVYNGQLYKVVSQISPQDPLNPDTNGNIQSVSVGNMMTPVVAQLGTGSAYNDIVKPPLYGAAVFKVGALCFVRIAFDTKSIPAVLGWKEIFTLPYTVSQDIGAVSINIVTREGKTTQIGVYQNVVRLNNPSNAIAEGDTISALIPYITTDY